MLWIAEPLVTKPSMVIHTHYKPQYHVRKMGCYLQGQSHSNWVWVHTMKSWLFLLYVLNCWSFGDQLSLTVHVRKLESLVKRLLCCIQGQGHSEGSGLQWMFARAISLIDQTVYGGASSSARVSFRNILLFSKVKATLVSTRFSEILKLLQSKLVWWYIITRQGETPWKYFRAFTQGVRQNMA